MEKNITDSVDPVLKDPVVFEPFDYAAAAEEFGSEYLAARLRLQVARAERVFSRSAKRFHVENVHWLHEVIRWGFKLSGTYRWGYRQFLDVRLVSNTFRIEGLPDGLDGFKMLHLSDLHMDLDSSLTERLKALAGSCECDICVLTGDYRNHTHGDYTVVAQEMKKLISAIDVPVYAILGNHDYIEMVQFLRALGVRVLINTHVEVEHAGCRLGLVGVDEPNVYMLENIERALEGIDPEIPRVLLSHSASVYRKAEAMGIDVLLSGHTHGGQLCLPGGIPVITNDPSPKKMCRGYWKHGRLQGYTSPGSGSCALPLRTFCPPEITLHTLARA